jgi:acetylornithine deacetylase/succinyl-diaminopimelate desuccinylase-like protein
MKSLHLCALVALALCFIPALAADKPKTAPETKAPYEIAQPATETLDLEMYQRIRDEGFKRSHIMEYAGALDDDIGPRLTGSPNLAKANAWTRDQLTAMGCSNAHLESWGEFGMGWQQLNTWLRMTAPDTAVFIAQATPWSLSTNGVISGEAVSMVVADEKDLSKYKGKIAGKIVLLGDMRPVSPVEKPLFHRDDDKELADLTNTQVNNNDLPPPPNNIKAYTERMALRDKVVAFLKEEKPLAVIVPSRDGKNGGGSGGTIFDDNGASIGRTPYKRETVVPVPVAVAAIENYGRVFRLLQHNVPITLEMNIETKFTGDHEQGFNTVAEIPGTDPKLKDQVVMVGGHLDSWIAGTGATDNGAGTVVAMEVMRIFNSLGIKPRRTIRIALWTGEEQGLFGSRGYAKEHLGSFPLSTAPDQMALPEYYRKPAGPLTLKPEQKLISGYFNIDNGTGKVRGIYLQDNQQVAPIFHQWMAPLADLGVTFISPRNTGGTDHLSFDAVGVPGFQFIQDEMDYESRTHHSNMDTYERLQPADLRQAAVVEAIFVYNAATRDQMLPRKPLPRPELNEQESAPLKNVYPDATAALNK